ncbi:MAG: hypothetical protein ACO1Q7_02060 [Gemmatimonas sp.]
MSRDPACIHCFAPLLARQTKCLACGSTAATWETFYALINEDLREQGIAPIDPDRERKEKEMWAQLDRQNEEAATMRPRPGDPVRLRLDTAK